MITEAHQVKLRRLARELSLARERERKRIAAELHDNIGQSLAFMRMKLLTLRGDAVFSGFDRNVDELLAMLDQTIRHTRTLCFQISPPVLHELGLGPALEWLAESFHRQHGLTVSLVETSPLPELDETRRGELFSSVRELLVNVVKHAGVPRAEIRMGAEHDMVRIDVTDHGAGFDPEQVLGEGAVDHGFGLFNIRERMEGGGGALACDSAPGRGCRITLRLPETDA